MTTILKNIALIALLVFSSACAQTTSNKYKPVNVDFRKYRTVHVDWINLMEKNWRIHGYHSTREWKSDIAYLNRGFQSGLEQYWLQGKKVSFSREKDDKKYPSRGLLITFDDAVIDYNTYNLHLSLKFVDLKTKEVLYTVSREAYYGNQWGFKGFLSYALDEVSRQITWIILKKKKSNLLK